METFATGLSCAGHTVTVTAVLDRDHGWNVQARIDGHAFDLGHCDDWHRVERLRGRLMYRLAHASTPDMQVQSRTAGLPGANAA